MADDALVVADLHIGLEEELREKGIHIPSRAEAMGRKLAEIASRRGASRIIILGDVKHLVPKMASRERRDVYVFFRDLASSFREIYIAQGNHDGLLKHIVPRNVRFKPAYGFRLDDTGFCHGHAWPYKKVMDAKVLVMGHNHPAAAFRDALGMETGIPAPGRHGEPHPRMGRNRTEASGGSARIFGSDPYGPLDGDARPPADSVRTCGPMARRHRGIRALLLAVSAPGPRTRPRLGPVHIGVLGRSASVPTCPRPRVSTSRVDLLRYTAPWARSESNRRSRLCKSRVIATRPRARTRQGARTQKDFPDESAEIFRSGLCETFYRRVKVGETTFRRDDEHEHRATSDLLNKEGRVLRFEHDAMR